MFNRSMSSHLPTPPLSCLYVNLKGTSNIFVPVRLQKSILPVFFSFLSFFFFFFFVIEKMFALKMMIPLGFMSGYR